MSKLVYSMIVSLDGYIEDSNGKFNWGEPEEDLHTYINDLESRTEILMYGRNLYDVMSVWEHMDFLEEQPAYIKNYASIWKTKQKIVFSKSLDSCTTSSTVLKKDFVASEIQKIKKNTRGDISIGGAALASSALALNLVDEMILFMVPVILGSGKKWIKDVSMNGLQLVETKSFKNDVLMVRYQIPHPGEKNSDLI